MDKNRKKRRSLVRTMPVLAGSAWTTPVVIGVLLPTHAHASGSLRINLNSITCDQNHIVTDVVVDLGNNEDKQVTVEIVKIRMSNGDVHVDATASTMRANKGTTQAYPYSQPNATFAASCPSFITGVIKVEVKAHIQGGPSIWHYF